MPAGPIRNPHTYWRGHSTIWNPYTYWRGHRPIRNPHASGGVTRPSGTHLLLEGSQALACKTSWDHFPMILGLRE